MPNLNNQNETDQTEKNQIKPIKLTTTTQNQTQPIHTQFKLKINWPKQNNLNQTKLTQTNPTKTKLPNQTKLNQIVLNWNSKPIDHTKFNQPNQID